MALLDIEDVGETAWRRLLRDGTITPLTTRLAAPADTDLDASLRARACRWAVPVGAAASALTALWIKGYGHGPLPRHIEVSVERGAHPDCPAAPSRGYRWSFVTDSRAVEAAIRVDTVRVVPTEYAIVGALRRSPHTEALPAVVTALRSEPLVVGRVERLLGISSGRHGRARMVSAWQALAQAGLAA